MSSYKPDPSLERALAALAPHVDFPEPRDLRASVLQRIGTGTAKDERKRRWRLRWQPAIAVAFVLLFALALTITALPRARRAVADLLGFDNLRIEVVETPLPELGHELNLGDAVSLPEASAALGAVPLLEPSVYTGSREIYVSDGALRMVSVVYGPAEELPAETHHDVSVLITAIDGDLHEGFAKKVVESGEAEVRPVEVRGLPGFWVSGAHAFFVYSHADGRDDLESSRISPNVLVWEEDGRILRIEGDLTQAEALGLAEDLVLEE